MIAVEKMGIERLKNPGGILHIMEPNEEKLGALADKLFTGYLYVPDEMRYPEYLKALVRNFYSQDVLNLIYEIGNFQGIVGFTNVIFDHKCDVIMKIWDKAAWTPDAIGHGRRLIHYITEAFGLVRLGTSTPDPKVVRMARLFGFEEEGVRKKAFSWDHKLYDETILSIVREG